MGHRWEEGWPLRKRKKCKWKMEGFDQFCRYVKRREETTLLGASLTEGLRGGKADDCGLDRPLAGQGGGKKGALASGWSRRWGRAPWNWSTLMLQLI